MSLTTKKTTTVTLLLFFQTVINSNNINLTSALQIGVQPFENFSRPPVDFNGEELKFSDDGMDLDQNFPVECGFCFEDFDPSTMQFVPDEYDNNKMKPVCKGCRDYANDPRFNRQNSDDHEYDQEEFEKFLADHRGDECDGDERSSSRSRKSKQCSGSSRNKRAVRACQNLAVEQAEHQVGSIGRAATNAQHKRENRRERLNPLRFNPLMTQAQSPRAGSLSPISVASARSTQIHSTSGSASPGSNASGSDDDVPIGQLPRKIVDDDDDDDVPIGNLRRNIGDDDVPIGRLPRKQKKAAAKAKPTPEKQRNKIAQNPVVANHPPAPPSSSQIVDQTEGQQAIMRRLLATKQSELNQIQNESNVNQSPAILNARLNRKQAEIGVLECKLILNDQSTRNPNYRQEIKSRLEQCRRDRDIYDSQVKALMQPSFAGSVLPQYND